MRGVSIVSSSSVRCRRSAYHIGAAVAAGADAEGEAVAAIARRQPIAQPLRFRVRRDEDEAGRPPGALPDPGKARSAQPVDHLADARARIAAALRRREMVADARVDLADGFRDRGEILFGEAREEAHQDEAAEPGGVRFREGGKRLEGHLLRLAREPVPLAVEEEDEAPGGR